MDTLRIPGLGSISSPTYTMGRPDRVDFPGGPSQTFSYDALLRLEQMTSGASGPNTAYTYDNVSNILTKSTEHGNYGYGYDDVSRLTSADNPVLADEGYTYDGVGNRATASGVNGTIVHTANNELTVYGELEYDYDANGNLVQKRLGSAAVNYVYDAANRLVQVEDDLTQVVIAEYGYDPFGRRLWKEVNGTRTYFLYADEGLVAEYDENGGEIRSYGYKPDSNWTTDPLFLKEGSLYYWYQNDHLGTPQQLIDMNGTVVWSALYTAFGEAQVQVEAITNTLRFPGQYFDAETGLHYNFHRYYDPEIGRYTKVDPIGLAGGDVNFYTFVENNSVNAFDPWGLWVGVDDIFTGPVDEILVAGYLYCQAVGGCQLPVPNFQDFFAPKPINPPPYPFIPAPRPTSLPPLPMPTPVDVPPNIFPPAVPGPTPVCDMTSYPPNRRPPSTPPGPKATPAPTPYVQPPYGGPVPTPTPPQEECDRLLEIIHDPNASPLDKLLATALYYGAKCWEL